MPGKHRLSTELEQQNTDRISFEDLLGVAFEDRRPETRIPVQGAGRHWTLGLPIVSDLDEAPAEVPAEVPAEARSTARSADWALPTLPVSVPATRRPSQPSWTAASMCADSPRQHKGRGRHRAGGNTGTFKLPSLSGDNNDTAMFPASTIRQSPALVSTTDQTESTTPGTVRSVAILAAVATGAVVVGVQDEAEAAGSSVEPTGGEHREVRVDPSSAPIPLPEVLTFSRDTDGGVNALARAVSREEHTFKEVGRPYVAEANGDQVDHWIAEALGLMGLPMSLAPGVRNIIMRESSGDPNAINLWDSNARKGIPSQGLMQTIPATYRACVLPSLADQPITDPVANITAGVRAMIANHGVATLAEGGRRNSSGHYIGYGGGEVPGANFVATITDQLRTVPGLL